jgi:hypothetical protein
MTAPSSPVPAVETVAYMVDCGNTAIAQGDVRFWRAKRKDEAHGCALAHGTVAVPLYRTPTPGRAAEPDTMGENRPTWSALDNATSEVAAYWSEQLATAITRAETAEAQLATLRAEVEVLRDVSEKATPGPWFHRQAGLTVHGEAYDWIADDPRVGMHRKIVCQRNAFAADDYGLIVGAVNFVRALLSNPKADR